MARHLRIARFLVLAIVALLLAGALPAVAQDLTAAQAQLEEALLTAEDLPPDFVTQDGVITGSNFDLDQAAFESNNGIAIMSQVWNRTADTGPIIVFDFRLLFPTEEDARNYLRDAETVISERDASGLKRDKNEPPIGDLHRFYTGSQNVSGQKFAFNNHLFTVGSMAAKVFVTGAPGSAAAARAIAEVAAQRMGDAQVGAPIVIDTPAPDPSAGPDQSAAPGPDLSGVFEAILTAHVGPGAGTCTPVKEDAFAGELAGISCPIGTKGELLVMRLLDSPESLTTAFEPFKGDKTGPTGTCEKKANLEPRLDGDVEVGQLACYDTEDPSRVFIWTDDRLAMIAWIVGAKDRPFKALFKLYESAGPIALAGEPTPTPTPEPTPEASIGPAPTLQAGLSEAQASLALHVPGAIRGTCGPTTINVSALATAAVLCTATTTDGTIRVTYQAFPDQSALDTAYAGNLAFLGATRDSGPCSGDWPAETTWSANGVVGGRVACAEIGGFSRDIAWTDDGLLILGLAETFDVPKEPLRQWWLNESGPVS